MSTKPNSNGAEHLSASATITRSQPLDTLPEFLTPDEFRTYLGLGRATVYELVRSGAVPHVRFGRLIRIPKSAFDSFLTRSRC